MTYVIGARYGPANIWVSPDFPGQPKFGPFTLPSVADGTIDVREWVASGNTENLGFVPRFKRSNSGKKIGDLLWTGMNAKIASPRFIDVLRAEQVTGYRTFPVEVVDRKNQPIGDFMGLAVEDGDPEKDLHWIGPGQAAHFFASDHTVRALKSAGVTGFDCKTPTAFGL